MTRWIAIGLAFACLATPHRAHAQATRPATARANAPVGEVEPKARPVAPRVAAAIPPAPSPAPAPAAVPVPATIGGPDAWKSVQTVVLFGLVSLAPAAILMMTSFVRIQIVLVLLRQAIGSPQIPGNQVLTALALLLTALVMKPVGEVVYHKAIAPMMAERPITPLQAWEAGSKPIKEFMIDQIIRTNHQNYLIELQAYAEPDREPSIYVDDYPFLVVAPAFLLSELTTAITIGFLIYLPFLVIDLVVSAVLAATGLFMMPPSLVAMPIKLILFVMADGWLLVASRLLQTFEIRGAG